jgi:hypothetical protein
MNLNEFYDDLQKTKYIKRHLSGYRKTGKIKVRLALNHIIEFYNVFGNDAATRILFYKLEPENYPQLKSFLTYLNRLPDVLFGVFPEPIFTSQITIDENLLQRLKKL